MNPFLTMEDIYYVWYLKHIRVSIFKSTKVSDFLPGLHIFFLRLSKREFGSNAANNNNRTHRSIYKLTAIFYYQCISTTNSILVYLTLGHYYNSPTRSRPTRKANPFIGQCLISSRHKQHPSLTGILPGLLLVPMACQTS